MLDEALRPGERFDAILLLGNNLGLLGGKRSGRAFLRKLARVATDDARLLAGSFDPYDGGSWTVGGFVDDGAGYVAALDRALGWRGVCRLRCRRNQERVPVARLFASSTRS